MPTMATHLDNNTSITLIRRTPRTPSPPTVLPSQLSTSADAAAPETSNSPGLAAVDTSPNTNSLIHEANPSADWRKSEPEGNGAPNRNVDGVRIAGSPPSAFPLRGQPRGGFSHASPPASPFAAYRQLAHPNNGYQSFGDYLGSSPGRSGPLSMGPLNDPYPPPPHHLQAHFYGAPEIDFGEARPQPEDMSPSNASCCMFDSLGPAGDEGQRAIEDVLLVGFRHCLEIYSVGKSKPTRIGLLDGLRGLVLAARILPATSRNDSLRSLRPLVAVVVHGLCESSNPETESRPGTSHSQDSIFDPSGSMLHALHTTDIGIAGGSPYFQTTVDVYSLKAKRHLATLLRNPQVRAEVSRDHPSGWTAPPAASLVIQASSKFIVAGSGASGELFIFSSGSGGSEGTPISFKCLGKFWTRTSQKRSRSLSVSSNSSQGRKLSSPSPPRSHRLDTPMFCLNHRWLAVVPPLSSAQQTMHAVIDGERSPQKVPGLTSHTAPSDTPVTCETDTPEAEGLLNRVARDVTQELMKGARWVGGHGIQAWNNYWSKPPDRNYPTSSSSYIARPSSMPQAQPSFPPTHADDSLPTPKSSQLTSVSLLDLEKLVEGQRLKPDKMLQPIATFSVPYGCSFVSFAPSGLHLSTTSSKGDVQQVWSLLRVVHGEAGHGIIRDLDGRAPFVREVKRFTRMTEANIVDVVWAQPRGEKLAVVTDRGTVHIYDIPLASYRWPAPRRVRRPSASGTAGTAGTGPTILEHDTDAAAHPEQLESRISAALNVVAGRTQPLFAAVRGRPTSAGSALTGWRDLVIPARTGATSGKAVTAGFNKSVGAATGTVNSLRHLGENRISLPTSTSPILPGCVSWLGQRNQGFIAVSGGNVVKIHRVTQSTNPRAGRRRSSVAANKPLEFTIPASAAASRKPHAGVETVYDNERQNRAPSLGGFWQASNQSHHPAGKSRAPQPLSCAEIETNA